MIIPKIHKTNYFNVLHRLAIAQETAEDLQLDKESILAANNKVRPIVKAKSY